MWGGCPQYHINDDVLKYINGNCTFKTEDGIEHRIDGKWDLLIAHPPYTYLTVSGNRWFNVERYGEKAIKRKEQQKDGIDFFMKFINADCDRIAVENPIGIMSTVFRKPDQIIQPFEYGEPARKATCLWLKGLPLLKPTNIVEPELIKLKNGKTFSPWCYNSLSLPSKERQKVRSRTFHGIAEAIADQWDFE